MLKIQQCRTILGETRKKNFNLRCVSLEQNQSRNSNSFHRELKKIKTVHTHNFNSKKTRTIPQYTCSSYFDADTCINVEGDSTAVLDKSINSCVKVPVVTETDGILKLFSLNSEFECTQNNSFVIVSLHFGNTTSETTCDDKTGLLASNGTECAGWKVCEVIFQISQKVE